MRLYRDRKPVAPRLAASSVVVPLGRAVEGPAHGRSLKLRIKTEAGSERNRPWKVSDYLRLYSSSIWLYIRLSWISYSASIASITEAGLAVARTVTSGESSITLLMATDRTGGIWRWSARFNISSSLRSRSM